MPDERRALTRAEVPPEFTPEAIRALPISTLRRLADHRNGILSREEQQAFDQGMRELMRGTAERVSRQLSKADWSGFRRDESARSDRPGRPSSRADMQVRRLAHRIGQQVDVAETLAPEVDWSFAQADPPEPLAPESPAPESVDATDDHEGTVPDLEQRITEQVELLEVMSEIADMSKRTYDLEQQRDRQSTRTVFFGFVVSLAVLVAGWAPLVAAEDWDERIWIIGLTLGTCLVAGAVYGLVRRWQTNDQAPGAKQTD
jgi:hypothetical protein